MKIAVLLFDGFSGLDAAGPYEVLSRLPEVNLYFVAKEGPREVVADTGLLRWSAGESFTFAPNPDVLVIPGGPGAFQALEDSETLEWVRTARAEAKWILTVCSGSILLAATGALRGKQATTSWFLRDALEQFGVVYQAEPYVRTGNIITGAGSATGIDSALLLAAEIRGEAVAQMAQLGLEYDPRPPFDAGTPQKASPEIVALFKQMEQER